MKKIVVIGCSNSTGEETRDWELDPDYYEKTNVVWLAFMFAWSWIWFLVINWGGHNGLKAEPTNLNWFCNIFSFK